MFRYAEWGSACFGLLMACGKTTMLYALHISPFLFFLCFWCAVDIFGILCVYLRILSSVDMGLALGDRLGFAYITHGSIVYM